MFLQRATSDYRVTHHRHKPTTEVTKETAHRETKPATETHQSTKARPRQPCVCPVLFASSLSFDFKIHRETFLFLRLALPVFGVEPSLCWIAPLKATGLPEDFTLVAVQEREHLHLLFDKCKILDKTHKEKRPSKKSCESKPRTAYAPVRLRTTHARPTYACVCLEYAAVTWTAGIPKKRGSHKNGGSH